MEIQYDGVDILGGDICVDMPEQGTRLHFDSRLQTLKYAHVYDLTKLRLMYQGKYFTGPKAQDPSLLAIYGAFGPSYPGIFDNKASNYCLNYPGVGFVFPIPQQFGPLYEGGEAPVELPDKTAPIASQMFVFKGKALSAPEEVSLSKITNALPDCELYFEPVTLRVGKGLEFPSRNLFLPLLSGTQDVIAVLGGPDKTYSKTENKLNIHSERSTPPLVSSYFYNYFSFGIDVLFDGQTHKAIKFVVHSNYPTHDSFNQYSKCNWTVVTEGGGIITSHHRWNAEVKEALSIGDVAPVVHNRPAGGPDDRGLNFHLSTSFYGRDGVILEVMKSNLIESVQLFI